MKRTEILIVVIFHLAIFVCVVNPVFADEDGQGEDVTRLDPVVVEGETIGDSQPDEDISAFGEVVLVEDLPGIPLTLSDALESLTGLSVRDFGGLGKLSTLTMRGFSPSNILIMLDGIPLNSSALGGVDLSDIRLSSIERIEIIRGPEAALYGNSSVAGVVNLISKSGDDDKSVVNFEFGSFGLITGAFSFSDKKDDFQKYVTFSGTGYAGSFQFLNDNGTTLDASDDFSDTRENNNFEAFGVNAGFHSTGERWEIRFDTDLHFAEKGVPGLVTFPTPDAVQTDERIFGRLAFLNQTVASGNGSFRFDLGYLKTSREYIDPTGGVTGFPTSSEWSERRVFANCEYSEFIGDEHFLITGIEYVNDEFLPGSEPGLSRNNFGTYIRDEITAGDHTIVPALRFDHIGDVGDEFSPKIGWRYQASDDTTIKANWGRGFRAPTFEELFRDEGFVVGNPSLVAETSWVADAGFIYSDTRFRLEADVFVGESTNLIEYVLGSGHRYHPLNFGKARMTGVECSLKWKPSDRWSLNSNITWTKSIDRTNSTSPSYGKQIPGRPRWDAFCGITYDDPSEKFTIDIGAYFSGGRFITAANTKELGDDLSFNFAITVPLTELGDVSFEIKNLFDVTLVDARGFPLPGRVYVVGINLEV